MTAARNVPARATVPRATYRVQLHAGFRFVDATRLVPYLAALGISHLYTSPPLTARKGSQHGYDIVDHKVLNPELGTRADFDAMVAALHAHEMGLVIDVVPNHMGVLDSDNAWWLDVLENGEASAWADFFDIDWHTADPVLAGKVLLPILGDQYGVVLEAGELKLDFDAARCCARRCVTRPRNPFAAAPARRSRGWLASSIACRHAARPTWRHANAASATRPGSRPS